MRLTPTCYLREIQTPAPSVSGKGGCFRVQSREEPRARPPAQRPVSVSHGTGPNYTLFPSIPSIPQPGPRGI